jgi:hypothetical protein
MSVSGINFTKEPRAATPHNVLIFDNSEAQRKGGIFKCIPWMNGPFL